MWVGSRRSTLRASASEELGTLADNTPLTGYEPNLFDDFHNTQRPLKSSSRSPPATAGPRTCMTWRLMTTPSAERSLHHCSLRSEKNQRAVDKLITLLKKVCCQVSRCLSVMLEQGDLFPMILDPSFQMSWKIQVATQKTSKSGFFWNDKKSKFSVIMEQRFKNTSSRPIMTEELSRNCMELSSLNEVKFYRAHQGDEQHRRSDFKALLSIQLRGENWSKIKKVSLNEQARFRNYRMKLIE